VGEAVGIEFRKIRVHKNIWHEGALHAPSVQLSNLYSYKVTGGYYDRSIWKLDSVDRYIAPENFILQLIEQVGDRVEWGTAITELPKERPIISTIPMNKNLDLVGVGLPEDIVFKHSPIRVQRFRIQNSDVFQTIYYPSQDTSAYRASVTGDLLIVESVDDPRYSPVNLEEIFQSFGIHSYVETIDENHKQSYGKIAPIDEPSRRFAVEFLSQNYGIYSLGRFATWRNILLDDVLHDLTVIKRLIKSDSYGRKLELLK
jgi:hypothetical protein